MTIQLIINDSSDYLIVGDSGNFLDVTSADYPFDLESADYTITVSDSTTTFISKTRIIGKHTKDSADRYRLYLNSGCDYYIDVSLADVPLFDINYNNITASFAKHSTSKNRYNMIVRKNIYDSSIRLTIPASITSELSDGKYSFDVIATNTESGYKRRLLGGDVFVSETI